MLPAMNRQRLAGIVVVGIWAAVAGIVVACGDDDATSPTTAEAGVDAQPTSTTTATATTTPPDTGVPTDAGSEAAADARAIWAFNAYCGDAVDAGCADASDCPAFDGGVAGQDCSHHAFERCVNHVSDAAVEKGIADRVFVCASVATPTWATTRICDYEPCDGIDAATCPGFGGDGIAGQACTPERARCLGNQRVFICEPNGLVQDFNGYCDAGQGTRACRDEVDACAPSAGGISGSACTDEHTRCYGNGSDGNKIFVCVRR
jgi:hypothetical protein